MWTVAAVAGGAIGEYGRQVTLADDELPVA